MRARRSIFWALMVLASAAPCVAQEFRIERDLDLLRHPDGRPLQNIYLVSLPLLPVIDDSADTLSIRANKCVGDPGGPSVGDGRLNSDDLICSWWTARADVATAGTFVLTWFDQRNCWPISRIGTVQLGGIRFAGTPFDLEADGGVQVRVSVQFGATYSPRNRAVLVGDDDPSWPGREIRASPTCPAPGATDCCGLNARRLQLVTFPYDAMYLTADEILCGLEGVDWVDANADGTPDICWDDADGDRNFDLGESPTGIAIPGTPLGVSTFVNSPDVNAHVSRTSALSISRPRHQGIDFALSPGEAYLLDLSRSHRPTLYLPPRN